ncbi:MAG: hypothetical protein ABR579_03480 [Actinomycetota bacterium]
MSENKLLAIYMNDHLAGSIAGGELAKRSAKSNEGTPLGTFLDRLADELAEDRSSLEDLMDQLGISKSGVKSAGAWLAEKAGRLKFNGQLTGYSDLSRLEELEGLSLGVEGKLSLWRALKQIRDDYPALQSADLEGLIERAQTQSRELEEFRRTAVETAF